MSKRFSLGKEDAKSIGWNTLIIAGAAGVSYLIQFALKSYMDVDPVALGFDPTIATAIGAFLIKCINKWVADSTKEVRLVK